MWNLQPMFWCTILSIDLYIDISFLSFYRGVEAIVVDYVRPNVVGAVLSRAAVAGVYALSVLTIGGLFYFNYTDVGLSQAIRMLWKL